MIRSNTRRADALNLNGNIHNTGFTMEICIVLATTNPICFGRPAWFSGWTSVWRPPGCSLQSFHRSAAGWGYECLSLNKIALLFFVVKDQCCDVQWQHPPPPPSSTPPSSTPPVERQIAYFSITCAGAELVTPAGRAQFSAPPCQLTYGCIDVLWLGRADPTQHALGPAVVSHLSLCVPW